MSADQEVEEIHELADAMAEKPEHLKKRNKASSGREMADESVPVAEDSGKGTGDFEHWSIRGKLFLAPPAP